MGNRNTIEQKYISQLLKVGLILTALVLPHLALKVLGIEIDVNPFVLTGILFTGFILFIFLLEKSIKHPVIPYILLQLILVWILFGKKILSPAGLDFKPHVIVFFLAVLASGYFLIKNFKDLWAYKPFKYLFIFFLISTIYAFFYKTDFRSSNYIDLWIQNNVGLRFNALQAGSSAILRKFGSGETKFLVYLVGLIPLFAFLSGFMSLWKASDNRELQNRLYKLTGFLSLGILIYYVLKGISLVIGSSTLMMMDGRLAIDGGFAGGEFEAIFLMLMIGFYYLHTINFKEFRFYNVIKGIIQANIVILSLLIILGIKKGTIISLMIACLAAFAVLFAIKKITWKSFSNNLIKPFAVPVFLLLPMFFINNGFVEDTVYNISNRFSTASTFDIRMINWEMYVTYWLNNLDLQKVLFGFGIDASREATFFLTAMHPNPSYQQPHIHNVYLEMFYNYGLMAFFFFLPFIYILKANLKDAFRGTAEFGLKIINVLAVGIIVFASVFYMAESPSMLAIIVIFALLGFLESVRNVIGHKNKILVEEG